MYSQYQVGTLVRILDPKQNCSEYKHWSSEMNYLIGKIYTIKELKNSVSAYINEIVDSDINNGKGWIIPYACMELVCTEISDNYEIF